MSSTENLSSHSITYVKKLITLFCRICDHTVNTKVALVPGKKTISGCCVAQP